MLHTSLTSHAIDDVVAGTFPASEVRPSHVIDVSRPTHSERTFAQQALASVLGAAVVALLLLLVILAASTPVALGVRGLLEVAGWFVAVVA